jgi:hypothetical protein
VSDDVGSSIFLGIIGTGIGCLAVDYFMSDPHESLLEKTYDRLETRLTSKIAARAVDASADKLRSSLTDMARRPTALPTAPASHGQHPVQNITVTPHANPATPSSSNKTQSAALSTAMVKEVATRLNAAFHLNLPVDGTIPSSMMNAIVSIQNQLGIPATGFPDLTTLTALRHAAATGDTGSALPHPQSLHQTSGWWTGAGSDAAPLSAEAQALGDFGESVVTKAILSENDPKVLHSLAHALTAAGFPQSAAAVTGKIGGAHAATGWW